jgi:O-antigen ligase
MSFCLNNKKRLVLEHYLYIAYIIFICGFFVLPVRELRDFYYLFVLLPFLALVYQKKNVFLFRSNVFWALITYLFFMCLTLFWADGAGFKESFNYVRKAFLTLSFVCVTVYLLHKDRNFLQSIFKWSCLVSGIMAIFWIILFYFVEGNVGRIGSIGWRSAPIQAGNVYALMALITCLLFCFRCKFLSRKFLLYCCVDLSLLVFVVLTGSRGSILSFLAVFFFCLIILDFKKNIVIICCFTLLAWIAFFFKVFDFFSLFERGSSYRLTIWQQSIDFLLEKPIFGYGTSYQSCYIYKMVAKDGFKPSTFSL